MLLWKNASQTSGNFPSVRECVLAQSPQRMGDCKPPEDPFCLDLSGSSWHGACLLPWTG